MSNTQLGISAGFVDVPRGSFNVGDRWTDQVPASFGIAAIRTWELQRVEDGTAHWEWTTPDPGNTSTVEPLHGTLTFDMRRQRPIASVASVVNRLDEDVLVTSRDSLQYEFE